VIPCGVGKGLCCFIVIFCFHLQGNETTWEMAYIGKMDRSWASLRTVTSLLRARNKESYARNIRKQGMKPFEFIYCI
jgi:hypothetical protein